ncbi:hypothetical protein Tco_1300880 [Tanacetum coccineum]
MHNNIMAVGSKDRPPMLGPGRYSQWRSRFLRYIDTKPNGGGLKKSILSGPYVPTTVQVQAVVAAEGRPAVPQHTSIETILNMTPENKEHFQLQQGESLNVQDVRQSVWEFEKFTSLDGEYDGQIRDDCKNQNKIVPIHITYCLSFMKQFQLEVNDIRDGEK